MFLKLFATLQSLREKRDQGATAVEYGLMVALIAAIIVATVALLGIAVDDAFQTVLDAITPAAA